MKDFHKFLAQLETTALIGQAKEHFNDIYNNQGMVAKGRIYEDDKPDYCAVHIAINLLREYHTWLHDCEEKM